MTLLFFVRLSFLRKSLKISFFDFFWYVLKNNVLLQSFIK